MTSNPTLGIQPPPQQRVVGGVNTAAHSRSSSQATSRSITNSARKLGLSVDPSIGGQRALPGDPGSGRPSPATSSLDSPSRSANGVRVGRQQTFNTEVSTPQAAATERPPTTQVVFPPRPGYYVPQRTPQTSSTGAGPSIPLKVDLKIPTFDPPGASLLYPGGKPADFHPWNGNHVEDNLTEQTVKSGFQNKPLITNETNTARPSVYGHLKKQGGLNTLSSLFVAVLEKRQTSSRLTGPSTFKPPPRVTLTNTKREAWLTDLANPDFALRRLNRTIPYGINGKILLEQCLSKDIPTARAVWLAKCIGANELRTLKRKGVTGAPGISGELKWIREWTMHVEQFVDTTVTNCGEESWKEKMQYVLRLVFHLFAEQLLDQEHYLDWILSAFESSTAERMPMWLVHIQLYWKFLVSNRKRGRRLAECLCAHLETSSTAEDSDLLAPARKRMELLVATLAISHRGCLILPRTWVRFEHVLQSLAVESEIPAVQTALKSLATRNNRLSKPSWDQNPHSASSSRRQAFAALDNVGLDFSIDRLTSQLKDLFTSVQDLVPIVLHWSSSRYRQGSHRTYIATRLLRRFKALGADIEMGVLGFITELPEVSVIDESKTARVVAELVRSRQFAVSRLLQSMIARGMVSNEQNSPVARRLIHLVLDIPVHDLPQHVVDLRQILLDNAGRIDIDHDEVVTSIQDTICQAMLAPPSPQLELNGKLHGLPSLNLSGKLEISLWLRQEIMDRVNLLKDVEEYGSEPNPEPVSISWAFFIARDVLERLEDISILADIVGICLSINQRETLTSIVDTIHYHSLCFAAIGALRPLVAQVIERYQSLRNEMPLERSFLQAISDLCTAVGSDNNVIQQLIYDIARCEQRSAMAICSPASDNAADMLSSTPMESDEQIEQILSSGTTMDEQSMNRVFKRLVVRLEEPSSGSCKSRCGQWFSRLRSFDEANFDMLMRNWVSSILSSANIEWHRQILPSLVGSSCLLLSTVMQLAAERQQSIDQDDQEARGSIGIAILYAVLPFEDRQMSATVSEAYKYRLEQRKFCGEFRNVVLKHLSSAIALSSNKLTEKDSSQLRSMLLAPAVASFLRDAAVYASQSLIGELDISSAATVPVSGGVLRTLLVELLDPTNEFGLSVLAPRQELARLVQSVDDLSLPFCQIEAQYLLRAGSTSTREATEQLASVLFDAILPAQDADRPAWLELIDFLDKTVLFRLRALAESRILKLSSQRLFGIKAEAQDDSHGYEHDQSLLRKLLCVVDCTIAAAPCHSSSENAPAASETLGVLRDILAGNQLSNPECDSAKTPNGPPAGREFCPYFNALLHLLAVHKKAGTYAKVNTADHAPILSTLFALLAHPGMEAYPATAEFVCDVAAQFADDLPDDVRIQLLRSESHKHNDDLRISFLLGPTQLTEGWLGLVTTNNSPSTAGLSGTPTTSAARFGVSQQQSGPRTQLPGRPQPPQRPGATAVQPKSFNPAVPFPLRRWELLPDQGSTTGGNDTSISLSLFGARKV